MLGLGENDKNKTMINLLCVLAKSAIWKRRNFVKIKNDYMDVWKLFTNLVEDYMFTLCNYWRMEEKGSVF